MTGMVQEIFSKRMYLVMLAYLSGVLGVWFIIFDFWPKHRNKKIGLEKHILFLVTDRLDRYLSCR